MKNLLTLVFVAILGIAAAQNNFEKGMLQAFELWNANKIENALNLFERIGNAEENEWLPHYYIAQINSIRSWNVKDETVLKTQRHTEGMTLYYLLGRKSHNFDV